MRIVIVGNAGSGKSTLARQLAARHDLALLDLDTVVWEPGKIAVAREPAQALAQVRAFCRETPRWVIEGCYAGLARAALPFAGGLLFLHPGVDMCIAHCRSRPWEPHKYRSRHEQDKRLELLLDWVRDYYRRGGDASLREHRRLFDDWHGPKQLIPGRAGADCVDELDLQAG